ncbi:MAG: hypothetical protein C0614_03125 [Desulfuromonas sp.]|nr:MAG: hypothetical protein C0614_03125 [Desulfuromonas sp.]
MACREKGSGRPAERQPYAFLSGQQLMSGKLRQTRRQLPHLLDTVSHRKYANVCHAHFFLNDAFDGKRKDTFELFLKTQKKQSVDPRQRREEDFHVFGTTNEDSKDATAF